MSYLNIEYCPTVFGDYDSISQTTILFFSNSFGTTIVNTVHFHAGGSWLKTWKESGMKPLPVATFCWTETVADTIFSPPADTVR